MRPAVVRRALRAALVAGLGCVIYAKAPALASWWSPSRAPGQSEGAEYWHIFALLCLFGASRIAVHAWRLNQRLSQEERASAGKESG